MDNRKQELDQKNALLRGEGIVDATTENTSKFDLIASYEKALTDEKNKQTDDYYSFKKNQSKVRQSNLELHPPVQVQQIPQIIIAIIMKNWY